MHSPRPRRALAAALLILASACTDRNPVASTEPTPSADHSARLRCTVSVKAGTLSCDAVAPPATPSGASTNKTLGGQDIYVKMASSGTSYDAGTNILQSNVTVQNLVSHLMGVDGVGMKVFFTQDPVVTSGTGSVTVNNEDGTDMFTDPNQEYFFYNQVLSPYQISSAKNWQFLISGAVTTFTFEVAVHTKLSDETSPLRNSVWDGSLSSAWDSVANWDSTTSVPTTGSFVTIPVASMVTNMPVLSDSVQLSGLMVGAGSTLDLNAMLLESTGNVDAPGTVSNGTVRMTGASAVLRGNLNVLEITGGTSLQGATKTTGAVSVSGSLSIQDTPLTVSVP